MSKWQECLKSGKIKKFSRGQSLAGKELRLAQEDLKYARKSFREKNYRWSIVQTYYSMFHAARSLLFHANYREHSHFFLAEAIRELYVNRGSLSVLLLESLLKAKGLREAADYYGDFSELNAKKLLADAANFIKAAAEILNS